MRRPVALLKRAITRWQTGNVPSRRDRYSEDGDTLVEVLLALIVLGLAGAALLTAFATSITSSAEHRNLASLDSSTRLASNQAIADVQQQSVAEANSPTDNPFRCTTSTWPGPDFSNVTGFTVTATVGYWNGTAFAATCTKDYVPQQYSLVITSTTGSTHYSTQATTVIYDPSAPPPPNGVGTPTQLVWLQTPTTGTVGSPVTPQPEVAVEDALNNIVSSDLSSVTLKVVTGPGQFSSTCSGVESYGIVQFSNCILNVPGTYTIQVVDSSSGVAPTSTATVVVTSASVAKLAFTTAAVTGTASATANAGPITVQEQDPFGNPTFSPETVNLSSSSTTGVFSLTPGGPAVTSVTIPGGTVSTVSFYYGDTLAGSPIITASAPPAANLAPITQTETIKAGPAAKFTLSTPTATAGSAFNETITAFDAFGNTATSFTGAQCITFSGPSNSPAPTNKAPLYPGRGNCATGVSSVTFTNGVGTPSITLYNAGATKLQATQGTITGAAIFTVASGALATLGVTNPGTQTAGIAFNVTITGVDAYSNPMSGTVSPTFSGPINSPNGTAPVYPASVTFTNGTAAASITLYNAGSTTLRVASGGVNASTTFTVNAGPFAGFTLNTPTPTAGTAFTETITAGDAYGNGGTGFTGAQCIAFSGPANSPNGNAPAYPAAGANCTSGSAVTFSANGVGTASITLFKSGATTLTAKSVSNPAISGSTTFTVASAAAKTFTIPTAPASQTAGTAFNLGIGATDTYGNPFGGTVTNGLSFSGPANSPAPSNTAPKYPTSLTFTNGAATASITLYDAQSTTLTVGATGVTQASTPITVTAGGASKFTLSTPTPAPTAGTPFTETITAVDGFANTATGFTGTQCVVLTGPANSPNGTAPIYPANGACANGSSLTFLNGVGTAQITLTDAQSTALTATQALVTGTSASFVVSAGAATTLTATSGANQSATTGSAFTNKLVATATDSLGNPVSGVAVTFAAPTSGASATFAACTSNPQATSCTQNTAATTGQATSSTFTANGTNGTYTITASATGLTSATFAEANKGNQTITFTSTAPGAAAVGGATYTAAATASSGLTVTFTSGSATVCTSGGTNGSVFTFVGSGTCIVDANQAGSTTFNAAPQVQQTFGVKNNQTVSFSTAAPGAATVGGANYTPAATATSGLAVTITVDNSSSSVCSISGGAVSFQATGSCVLDANQAGNTGFYAAPQVQQTFTVGKGSQAITFSSTVPSAASVGGATYTAAATASSGLTVTFTSGSATVCTSGGTNGSVFTFVGNGTCIVDANQAGNGNYNAAPQVQQTFGVKHSQTITFTSTAPGAASVGGATYTPAATATSALAVTISLDASSTGCALNAGVVSFTTPGTCVLDANQAGNTGFYAAPQVQQTFTVNKGNQTITFTSTAPGAATVGGATYTAAATANSGLTVAFSSGSTSVCTSGGTNGSVFTFVGSGSCIVDANQAGNGNWNAASQAQQTFTVNKNNQTVSFSTAAPGAATVGGANYTPAATATSGLAVTITVDNSSSSVCSISGGAVELPGDRLLRSRRQPGREHRLLRGAPGPADLHGRQGQPSDHLQLHGAERSERRRGHLHRRGHRFVRADGHVHFGLGHGLHVGGHQRLGLHLRRERHLHR